MSDLEGLGVECGHCGGTVYMETCATNGGPPGHDWVVASECQSCGARYEDARCFDCERGTDG